MVQENVTVATAGSTPADALFYNLDYPWAGPLDSEMRTGSNVQSFMVSAGLYMAAFAFGTIWDYRSIFLIFVLPTLVQLTREGQIEMRFLLGGFSQ